MRGEIILINKLCNCLAAGIQIREQNSGFYDIEEIMEVSGIGEKTFAKLEPYITVE